MNASDQPVSLRLKPSRQFPFLARHPWVHAHALAEDGRDLECGQIVDLVDHDGNWLARGMVNPASRLRIRLYAFDQNAELSPDWWSHRIDQAIERRRLLSPIELDGAERLIFSESDLMSGLIVDRYADCLSVQFTSAAMLQWKDSILQHLQERLQSRAILIRMEAKTAKHEGVESVTEWYQGNELSEPVIYHQNDLQLAVDLRGGQKTGGYLDQRLNHLAVAGYLKRRRVLDVCCYAGGFGLVAAKQGATSITGIDSSEPALQAAREAAIRNGISNAEYRQQDCFEGLKELISQGESFDAVVLDPPRFAGSRHQIESALRAYGRLNAMAVDLLPSGGVLATCSCSGRVSRADFLNMLADVGRRRRRDLVLLENRGPAPDHPVAISCPESDYLKCVIAQVH
ncbi:MAG: class I SAM-dependent rRNA methyltransferase [Planctomycetota bacterium]